jgi:pyridoxamine 5'-phosphate oxidase
VSPEISIRTVLRRLPVFDSDLDDVDFSDAPADPYRLAHDWLLDAIGRGEPEPHAMTLSTCAADGTPDARVLILKDLDQDGWWFATSNLSGKGQQLAAAPNAALTFHWKSLARQMRVRGSVRTASPADSASDFRARGLGARAVALASHESQPLRSRAECELAVATAHTQLAQNPELIAPHWTIYVLAACQIEFWQADPQRQHRRLEYRFDAGTWTYQLLWP